MIPSGIKSKIILVVGKGSSNTTEYLSSIMTCLNISHSKYINAGNLDLKNIFVANNKFIDIKELCETSASIIKKSKRSIASDELCFLLSLLLLDGVGEYIIIEMSDSLYLCVAEKSIILPHAVIFSTPDDILSIKQKELVCEGTKEIITLSEKDNYSYISSEKNANGVRINTVSSNKIIPYKANLMETEFYYNNQPYHISSIDQNNIPLACLAVEGAKNLFISTYPLIYNLIKEKLK